MSLPAFSTQTELFSTAGLSAQLFAQTDRYRLFAKLVYPALAAARGALAKCYCAENGRVAIEPVLMMGVSFLQYLDDLPDRQALEMLRYHAGWNFALNRQLGDPVFHPPVWSTFASGSASMIKVRWVSRPSWTPWWKPVWSRARVGSVWIRRRCSVGWRA